jgi:uncharacterized protein YcaQ
MLAPARSLPAGLDGVREVFARLGSVQFDPLAVAGRNHDLVLHARVADYDPAWTQELLYGRRELFETYNKALSILPTSELPWHRLSWQQFGESHRNGAFARHQKTVDLVLQRIRREGPLSSLDFERGATVDWYWGPTSEVRATMEALSEAGIISLQRREGNRRYFDLTERLYPGELLAHQPGEREQRRHRLLTRYRAHGLLGEGGQTELWSGIAKARRNASDPPRTVTRADLRAELLAGGDLVAVDVEGVRGTRYVVAADLDTLRAAEADVGRSGPMADACVAFLAPLDPLAWDRNLMRSLFDFDYVWEVYVPEQKRRWGYYVLPILFGDRLVGRIEPRIDAAARTVRVHGVWWQDGFDPRKTEDLVDAMRDALAAYLRFGNANRVEWGDRAWRERRLFGVRPKSHLTRR